MLIKALCDYYDCQNEKESSAMPDGYAVQAVSWQVHLTENGEISAINDCRNEVEMPQKADKPAKIKKIPREILLPERSQKTAIFSNIIEHRPLYIFGLNYSEGKLTPEDNTGKAEKSHKDFVERNLEFFEDLNSPVCTAYKNFIKNWNPAQQTENGFLLGLGKEYASSYFCFVLDSDITKSPQNDAEFIEKYQKNLLEKEKNSSSEDVCTAVCPIIGDKLPTARIHDKIKFPGGNSSGCILVGMKESAYESYGKTQSYNSNISELAMKKYTASFNSLVNDQRHRVMINEMVIVFFSIQHDDTGACDLFARMFNTEPKVNVDKALEEIMVQIKAGTSVDYSTLGIEGNAEFYVAGFTPNSSRICQKFIIRNSFGKIMENVAHHQADLATAGNEGGIIRFGRIAKELVSPESSKESVPPPLMAGIIRAAVDGGLYPMELLATVIRRIKTDRNPEGKHFTKMNPTRIGIVKACLNRLCRKNKKEEIKMALDLEEKNAAYLCGRLFAVLEKIQQDSAQGRLNATILDGYFSSACTRPATVFPRLVELSNHHIRKLETGAVIRYKKLLGSIMGDIGTAFPPALDLENQGRFVLGYYQQNQSLYTQNNKNSNADADKEN